MAEVLLETNHGVFELEYREDEKLGELLHRHGVPLTAVWSYVVEEDGDLITDMKVRRVEFIPSMTEIRDIDGVIHVRSLRNIDIPRLMGVGTTAQREVERPTTEWVFPGPEEGSFARVISQLTAEECTEAVRRSVEATIALWPEEKERRLLVGVSGGGDSNILLSALVSVLGTDAVVPTMMLGIPDWDTQLANARELCESHGTRLEVIDEHRAAELAGVQSIGRLREQFHEHYPDADLEFLGTWLLRKVLGGYAQSLGLEFVGIGSNREDVVAEGLACLARGWAPLPIPFRRIEDITFVYPMWQVPKKIGDGAFITYSLENYEARNPSSSRGRSIFYYAAYMLAEAVPGLDVTLVQGFSRLGNAQPDRFEADANGELALATATANDRQRWAAFLEMVRRDSYDALAET